MYVREYTVANSIKVCNLEEVMLSDFINCENTAKVVYKYKQKIYMLHCSLMLPRIMKYTF